MKKVLFVATALLLSTAATAQMPPQPGWNGGSQQGWNGGPPPPPNGGPQPGWHGGQRWDGNAFWRGAPEGPRERIQFLQERVNRGMADGSLDRREGMRVNRELNGVRQWIRRMHWQGAGRLNPDQRAQVQGRLDQISQQIRWMHHLSW
jgi:hypothetical protein